MPSTPVQPRPHQRPEGQWAFGQREPLNHNEAVKAAEDALNVRARIEERYAHGGFDSIDPDDLRGRFRWWGLYTQRRPGLDGRSSGALEPHELEDRYFMMRVRIDGGQLDVAQLRAIAEVSTVYARDTADITDRQNVQYHWVCIEDVPAIWQRLEAAGLQTTEACGDCPRVVIASPVAGITRQELVDPTPAVEEIERRYVGNPDFANLPRKFKTAITGHPVHDVAPEINDVAFVATIHPELGPGFDLWVGGGLSTNPMFAKKLGVWIALDEVPDIWEGVVSVFRDYGYRRLRNRARLKFLVADWGADRFREILEQEYVGRRLVDCASPSSPDVVGDHVGVHEQSDGLFYVGAAPAVGRVSGTLLSKLADVVEAHGSNRVRTTVHQKLLVLDVAGDRVDSLVAALEDLGLSGRRPGAVPVRPAAVRTSCRRRRWWCRGTASGASAARGRHRGGRGVGREQPARRAATDVDPGAGHGRPTPRNVAPSRHDSSASSGMCSSSRASRSHTAGRRPRA